MPFPTRSFGRLFKFWQISREEHVLLLITIEKEFRVWSQVHRTHRIAILWSNFFDECNRPSVPPSISQKSKGILSHHDHESRHSKKSWVEIGSVCVRVLPVKICFVLCQRTCWCVSRLRNCMSPVYCASRLNVWMEYAKFQFNTWLATWIQRLLLCMIKAPSCKTLSIRNSQNSCVNHYHRYQQQKATGTYSLLTQLFANIARQGNFVIGSRHSKSSLVLVDRVIHLAWFESFGTCMVGVVWFGQLTKL